MPSLVMEDKKLPIGSAASQVLHEISRFLAEKEIPAFIVGGFVRDTLLGRDTDDIDIAVDADALEVASQVSAALDGRFVPLDDVNLIGRVMLPEEKLHIDFTTFKGDIREDLARRDFTIDAMAIELAGELDFSHIIDPFCGHIGMETHLVKVVDEAAFQYDAARLLRAIRLAAELDFNIEGKTEKLISRDSSLIGGVAGERVREELLGLLTLPGAGPRLFYMDKLGLLTALFPELEASKGVEQPKEHAWDVFDHSLQTVATLEFILRESPWEYADKVVLTPVPWSERLSKHFDRKISSGSTARSLLKLAALFHDIAKPQTKAIQDGRTRFLGHAEIGAEMTSKIMERLRFSKKEIQLAALLVKYHLRPTQMSHEGMPTDRAIYRYFRDIGEAGIDLFYLCLADHLAARASALNLDEWREHCRMTEYVLDKHFTVTDTVTPPKILDGHEIMSIFNLDPGPMIGRLLEEIREAQAAGEIATREEAVAYVKRLLSEMK
jgi:poly(A) polymerase